MHGLKRVFLFISWVFKISSSSFGCCFIFYFLKLSAGSDIAIPNRTQKILPKILCSNRCKTFITSIFLTTIINVSEDFQIL